jgi:tetratricopeptide (TPR) repeat protein
MKKLGSIVDDKDEEILQLYLDLYRDSLSFSAKQDLVERILVETKSFTDRLHYKGTKAVLFLTILDRKKAETELTEAIEEARGRKNLTEYERYRFAETLSLAGALRADSAMLDEAIDLYRVLLDEGAWTALGRATLLGLVGETYRRKQQWEEARQAYEQALEMHPLAIDKVFLAECFLQLEQLPDATRTLREVQLSELSAGERIDYAFTFAAIAIEMGDRKRLEEASTVLKALQISDPLFREQRDALLLNVREAFSSGPSRPLTERSRRLFAGLARFVSTYGFCKPSLMGVGVDFGKILEDLSKRGG